MEVTQELTKPEQSLIWDQGFMDAEHPSAPRLLSITEALKASGYDLATILGIVKGVQSNSILPEYFSIINNKYLVFPITGSPSDVYVFDLNDGLDNPLTDLPDEPKLMALTFWLE